MSTLAPTPSTSNVHDPSRLACALSEVAPVNAAHTMTAATTITSRTRRATSRIAFDESRSFALTIPLPLSWPARRRAHGTASTTHVSLSILSSTLRPDLACHVCAVKVSGPNAGDTTPSSDEHPDTRLRERESLHAVTSGPEDARNTPVAKKCRWHGSSRAPDDHSHHSDTTDAPPSNTRKKREVLATLLAPWVNGVQEQRRPCRR